MVAPIHRQPLSLRSGDWRMSHMCVAKVFPTIEQAERYARRIPGQRPGVPVPTIDPIQQFAFLWLKANRWRTPEPVPGASTTAPLTPRPAGAPVQESLAGRLGSDADPQLAALGLPATHAPIWFAGVMGAAR
jgi:hypothetical protein